jgi:hypothetical protein
MAQATVTLKVTPNELQVVAEALRMYARANRDLAKDSDLLEGYQLLVSIGDGNNRKLAMMATKIRQDIGLK